MKTIGKAFLTIVMVPLLVIGGIFAIVPVAQMSTGGISHPLMAFPAIILMLPWGLLFVFVFFYGVGTMRTAFGVPTIALFAPVPSFVVYSHGQGGYSVTSGKGHGGGIVLALIKFVLAIPLAIIVWIIVSILLLFIPKMEKRMNDAYKEFVSRLKSWYKYGLLIFVVFPLVVVGFNAIENAVYSPENIHFSFVDCVYEGTDKAFSSQDNAYHYRDCYTLKYTIRTEEENLEAFFGQWVITDKITGERITLNEGSFVSYNWDWAKADKSVAHEFTVSLYISNDTAIGQKMLAQDWENLDFSCKINQICYDSNIPILGDFLFPTIENTSEDGYILTVKM